MLAGPALAVALVSGCRLGDLFSPAGGPQGLVVRPVAISDSAVAGQGGGTTVRLRLSPRGADPRRWSAAVRGGSPWLRLGASQGTAPDDLAVQLVPDSLMPGLYADTVDLTPTGGSPPLAVPVWYAILAAGGGGGPGRPTGLGQFDPNGAVIPVGGTSNGLSVVLKATLPDSVAAARVALQVEVVPTTQSPLGNVTAQSAPVGPGQVASVSVTGLLPLTAYQWRCRAVDQAGHVSPWVAFGGNPAGATDFATPLL